MVKKDKDKDKDKDKLNTTIDQILKEKDKEIVKTPLLIEQKNNDQNLPALIETDKKVVVYSSDKVSDPLAQYIREIRNYELLSREQEDALTKALFETGDINVAKELVVHNLRLVVKIAMEYRNIHQNVMDLIQEGNIGLMKAVSKYDPSKGAKLSYYASWWIKSYILKFILDNFRLIKIGTTNEQKKLFYNLVKEKEKLKSMGIVPDNKILSENLGVSEKSVALMDQRLSSQGAEISIDKERYEDGSSTLAETISDPTAPIDEKIARAQEVDILNNNMGNFLATLKERDRIIFKKRLLSEIPPSLQSIANDYGVSRERIRQIEERLLKKLKVYMSEFLR